MAGKKKASVKELVSDFSREDLSEFAKELGVALTASQSKPDIAKAILNVNPDFYPYEDEEEDSKKEPDDESEDEEDEDDEDDEEDSPMPASDDKKDEKDEKKDSKKTAPAPPPEPVFSINDPQKEAQRKHLRSLGLLPPGQ